MTDSIKVLELLNELEDLVASAPAFPLTNKVVVVTEDVYSIIKDIRLALPDDVQQAHWIVEEKDRILSEAKADYERIVNEGKKEADSLVEESEITQRARKLGQQILNDAQENSRQLKYRTYDYMDKLLYDMQGKMDDLNMKYFGEMYTNLEHTFKEVGETLSANREEIQQLAYRTQNENNENPEL